MSKKKTTKTKTKGKATAAKALPSVPKGEKTATKLSCLDAAAQVLKGASAPMTCKGWSRRWL